ncbi:MAG: ribose 5-phosphate isomerase B [Acutalibacteraceae bacterium]
MIALACDHSALEMKQMIKDLLDEMGLAYHDFGTDTDESCDYPRFAFRAAKAVASGECDRGIVICGTGIGMSIAANKIKGIRCALCGDPYSAKLTRQHNDSNMLALGARVTGIELARMIAQIWLTTPFEGGRHQRRIDLISDIEEGKTLD